MRWLERLNNSTPNTLQHGQEIALENCEIPVTLRRHPKARRLTLRVNATNRSAVITVPPSCSDRETLKFLNSHKSWLYQQVAKIPEPVPFSDQSVIPLRGTDHKINFAGAVRGKGVVWLEQEETDLLPLINVTGNAQFAPRRLKNWLIKQARKDIYERSQWHANNLGLKFKKIMIKDQRSRWGSCSSNGVLSYSWRLILSPPEVLDYVAAHEVAHLQEMNHGPNFWALVHKTLPTYEGPKDWLRDNGTDLHRYGMQG